MVLDGKGILITGGTGSFGQLFVERVLRNYRPSRLVVFSRDELKQFEMQQKFHPEEYPCLRYFIGDVRDVDRLEMAMHDVEFVVHAAALKQVPVAEYNPFECIRTNVVGAENVVMAAIRKNIKKVVALSTDKAANPINLYGASKLASDKIFVAANNIVPKGGPKFSVVRYGNVVGSRGSVVPFFRSLINNGARELPITDERMTRFSITLEEGVTFVVKSFAAMQGGEIFVPKIPSVRICDLATAMAPDLAQSIVGIRPGEKLHELMITADDSRQTLDCGNHFLITPMPPHPKAGTLDWEGERVSDGFEYSSKTNRHFLSVEEIREMLARIE